MLDAYRNVPRDVPWPGNQINDINQFREMCYRQCHEQNPTDSGWYEKVNECGQQCKYALKAYEYMQGKNPCELRLQAPVFWFQSHPSSSVESYARPSMPMLPEDATTTQQGTDNATGAMKWSSTDVFYMTIAIIVLVILLGTMMNIVWTTWTARPHPRRRSRG